MTRMCLNPPMRYSPCARHIPRARSRTHAHSTLRIAWLYPGVAPSLHLSLSRSLPPSISPCVSLSPPPSRVCFVSLPAGQQPVSVFFVCARGVCWHSRHVARRECPTASQTAWGMQARQGCRVVAWQGTSSHGDVVLVMLSTRNPYTARSVADMQEPDALPPLLHAGRCGGKRRQCGCRSDRQHPAGPARRGRSRQ
jgi:hypothetical protein